MVHQDTISPSMKAARMMGPLPIGQRFPYFFIDPRTRGDPLQTTKLRKKQKKNSSANFMSMMHGVSGDDRRHVGTVLNNALLSWRSVTNEYPVTPIQPKVGNPVTSAFDRAFQNTFLLDGVADASRWVYIPVRIVYKRPNGQCFQPKLIQNGRVIETQDMYAPSNYKNLQTGSNLSATYAKCSVSNSGAEKIFVQADGISYTGKYKDYVIIDGRQPVSSAIAYVAVKNPNLGESKVYISAFDLCGRMCKPRCLNLKSVNGIYEQCSGAIIVTKDFPKMFGRNFGEAVSETWNLKNKDCPDTINSNIYMTFYCENDSTWPW
ncbi:hypothetical protein KUTeg_019272 [Tegillarca granosa]|uniref:Uncharacterized protein n=1 Tax=Tegillarca granosa TaxID=220873 RepID=A0ABQ9EGA3_TEGGR|nr:hypothetical protein KUTeg_019272 [Tegillarca granosa]